MKRIVYRYYLQRKATGFFNYLPILGADGVVDYAKKTFYKPEDVTEKLYAIFLDKKNFPIGYSVICSGGLHCCVMDRKLIAKTAIGLLASSVIILHTHPNGDATPSQSDIEETKRLRSALLTLDIKMLDHVILGEDGSYYSFADEHLVKEG